MFAPSFEQVARFALVLTAAAALAACTAQPAQDEATPTPAATIGFLAVGDTGYHYDFLDPEDYDPPLSLEQFTAKEREDWAEDHRPSEQFTPPPVRVLPLSGGVVAASGLMPVANAMQNWCETRTCDFGAMLGDNIYPDGATAGADGRDDAERFAKLFVKPFAPLAKGKPEFRLYVALGNHDWNTSRAGADSQLEFHERTRPFYMDDFVYRVRPPAARGEVELFVIDTELLLSRVAVPETAIAADGSGVLLDEFEEVHPWAAEAAAARPDIAAWLEAALASSTARWKIVIGHHPIWSTAGSKFAQAQALRKLILPAMCRHADLYFAGHEHTLEAHRDDCKAALPGQDVPPLLQIVSGAGAKQRPSHPLLASWQQVTNPELTTLYAKGMVWGFAHVELVGDQARIRLVSTPNDGGGRPVEEFTLTETRRSAALRPNTRP